MNRRSVLTLTVCIFLLLSTIVLGQSEGIEEIGTIEGITEYRPDNGLIVLLYPVPSEAQFTVCLTVFVGSRHEGYGETGMAHLLEHMTFSSGTKSFRNLRQALQERGASRNGTTSYDRTNYFETLPAGDDNLRFAIQLEAERLVQCPIRSEDLASEMTVVRNEFDGGENDPSRILRQRVYAVAYDWHNYGKATIGNLRDVENVSIDGLRAFYKKYYQPDNAILVVAGRFDRDKALEYVSTHFGSIPRPSRKLPEQHTSEPPQDGARSVELRRVGETAEVLVAYHVPGRAHPNSAALSVLAHLLSRPPTGRLYKAIVEPGLASSAGGFPQSLYDPGLMVMSARVPDTDKLEEVRDEIVRIVESIGDEGVTEEEVLRARQLYARGREVVLSNSRSFAISAGSAAAQGDWRLVLARYHQIGEVTRDDVRRVASRYLTAANRTVGLYVPTDNSLRVEIPAITDVAPVLGPYAEYQQSEAEKAMEAFAATPTNIRDKTIRRDIGSIRVAYLPKPTHRSWVQVRLVFRFGDAENLKGMRPAAGVLPTLMVRGGTKRLSREEITDKLDEIQTSLRGYGYWDDGQAAAFTIRCQRERLPAALEVLHQVLREPLLPEDLFEESRRRALAGLERTKGEPSPLARQRYQRLLKPYPKDDVRYVPTLEEQIERHQGMTHQQVVRLYREYLGAQAGELAVVGDFDLDAVHPAFEQMLADWAAPMPCAEILPEAFLDVKGSYEAIQTPDKENAVYQAGLVVPVSIHDPDYVPLRMAVDIFGRGSDSRLFDRIREREGLSYHVGASFSPHRVPRFEWSMTATANPTDMDRLRALMREELEQLVDKGVTDAEVSIHGCGLLESRRTSWSNDAALAGLLTDMLSSGRTLKWQIEFEAAIQKITAEEVNRILRKRIDPERLVVVTAGDFSAQAAE